MAVLSQDALVHGLPARGGAARAQSLRHIYVCGVLVLPQRGRWRRAYELASTIQWRLQALLLPLPGVQAATRASLSCVSQMRAADGSPLPMDRQLCGTRHVRALSAVYNGCLSGFVEPPAYDYAARRRFLERVRLDGTSLPLTQPRPSTTEAVMIVLNYILCLPPALLVTFLTMYHYVLVCTNTTSIETWEKDRVSRQIRRGQIPYIAFPFDLGCWSNLLQVLGPSPLTWLWPCAEPLQDGTSFPVAGTRPEAQFLWPPKDPRVRRRPVRPTGSAFTYGEEQLNPRLRASHADAPQPQAAAAWHASAPHYPHDEVVYDSYSSASDDDMDDYAPTGHVRVRRGSEGLEVMAPQYSRVLWDEIGAEAFPPGTEPPPEERDPNVEYVPGHEYPHGTFAEYG